MKTATKAEVTALVAASDVAVTIVKPTRKARSPKAPTPFADMVAATQAALTTEIGAAPNVNTNEEVVVTMGPPAPRKLEGAINHKLSLDLYAMPAGVVVRPGTRKAAVYDAMCAISPATRTDLIAAAEMAEQEWRGATKRLEVAKPGAKWFRRFAPVVA